MRLKCFLAASLIMTSLAAHATPVTYYVDAYNPHGTLTGTIDIDLAAPDTSPESYTNINFTMVYDGQTYNGSNSTIDKIPLFGTEVDFVSNVAYVNTFLGDVRIAFRPKNPNPDGSYTLIQDGNTSELFGEPLFGTITPTPEPSSLALLCTGILGIGGVLRRRFV